MHSINVLKLYKIILRLHRALPKEMKELGDQYVRDEFKRHKNIGKEFVAPFMIEWSDYGVTLAKQIGLRGPKTASKDVGKAIDPNKLDDFESQQIYQLYELRKSIAPITEEVDEDENNVESLQKHKAPRINRKPSSSNVPSEIKGS